MLDGFLVGLFPSFFLEEVMKNYVIFDLDGCIADDRRRLPLIDPAAQDPWAAYHAGCEDDPLMNEHWAALGELFEPIIFTARPESVREKTERWLERNTRFEAMPLFIFMRAEGCLMSSPALKESYLKQLFEFGVQSHQIILAIDDREDVVAMYRANGLRAALVNCSQK